MKGPCPPGALAPWPGVVRGIRWAASVHCGSLYQWLTLNLPSFSQPVSPQPLLSGACRCSEQRYKAWASGRGFFGSLGNME